MNHRRLLFLRLALSLSAFLVPRSASAAIAVSQEQNLARLDASGNPITKRPLTSRPEGVSRRDCDEDQRIRFPLHLSDLAPNASLQAWASVAGADCSSQTSRSGASAVCWQLVPSIPLQSSVLVDIPVRKLMSGAPPSTPLNTSSTAEICGKVDLTSISVHFLYFGPGEVATPQETKALLIDVDTVGPPAPTGLTVTPDGIANWQQGSEGIVQVGTRVYCAPIETAATCAFAPFGPPAPVPTQELAAEYECGSLTGQTGTAIRVQGTSNGPIEAGRSYAFAVSTIDTIGNFSPLSPTACAVVEKPAPSADSDDGGCSSSGRPARGPVSLASFMALALALAARAGHRRRVSERGVMADAHRPS